MTDSLATSHDAIRSGGLPDAVIDAIGTVLAAVVRLLRNPGLTWRRQLQSLLGALALFGLLQRVLHRAARIGAIAIVTAMVGAWKLTHPPAAWAAP